jgi:hypothetical protein
MKILVLFKNTVFFLLIFVLLTNCNKDVTEFGFNGAISGKVKDQAGNFVAGDITSTNLSIKALGEGDKVTIDMRVKGDGSYENNKQYPKKFKIWVSGPVTMTEDTLRVDFSSTGDIKHDFVVIPFLTIKSPLVVGTPTSSSVTVSFEIAPNGGKVTNLRQLYCSTIPYPNATTGSGPYYDTKTVTMTTDSGNAIVTGLTSKTKYYLRVGARATGATGLNYSDQIVITTP